MSNEKLVNLIKLIQKKYDVSSCNLQRYIKNHYPKIYKQIEEKTKNLEKFKSAKNKFRISIFEKIYCLEHNLDDRPLCKVCGKNYVNRFNVQTLEYGKWCCPACQASDQECLEKSFKTREEKYGTKSYINVEKSKITRLEKYGGYCPKDFSEKVKKTKLANHGNENFVNSEKCKKTKLERYGNENFNNHDKTSETKLERYGNENFNNREQFKKTLSNFSEEKKSEIKEKRVKTCLEKYGVSSISQIKEIKEKRSETCLEKYGVKSSLLTKNARLGSLRYFKEKTYTRHILNNEFYEPLFSKEEYLNTFNYENKKFKYRCKGCGKIFETSEYPGSSMFYFQCKKCHPYTTGTSNGEKEVFNFLNSITNLNIINRCRKLIYPLEVDIFIPEKNIAIEYDGLFFHQDNGKNMNYHLNKTIECENKGIRLIHIFENEWLSKQEIVKSKLKSLLNLYDKTIYARNCQIKNVNTNDAYLFCEKNHLQGFARAKIYLGLYFEDELVSIMSFSKPRFSKKYEYELIRFCNKLNTKIIGAASKLLKYFEEKYKPKSIVSYADRRWSTGDIYKILKFEKVNESKPNYWYWKDQFKLFNRIEFQKHKLKNVIEKFDENLSEYENMKNNGYFRIFDCGNLVFVKTY